MTALDGGPQYLVYACEVATVLLPLFISVSFSEDSCALSMSTAMVLVLSTRKKVKGMVEWVIGAVALVFSGTFASSCSVVLVSSIPIVSCSCWFRSILQLH
jgi:hypothetical protein